MVPFLLYTLFFSSIFADSEAFRANRQTVNCSHGSPVIHFPFQPKIQQPGNHGHPGFELVCKNNTTFIHFPSYGDLIVKSILYKTRKLSLVDPKDCVHEVFLNLDLSLTPFQYYFLVKNYTYLNCSSRLPPSFPEVTCLSGSTHHVYTVQSSLHVPASCRPVKTVAIPFAYSPYLADDNFGLKLTWKSPECKNPRGNRQTGCFEPKAPSFNMADHTGFPHQRQLVAIGVIFIFMVATIIGIKLQLSKKSNQEIKANNHLSEEKSLGDYEAIKLETC